MKLYHLLWLCIHPHRSNGWLQEKLNEGFDIHHVDGNKGNNAPANLILLEHTDHMMLHSGGRTLGRLGEIKPKMPKQPRKKKNTKVKRKIQRVYVSAKRYLNLSVRGL